MVSIEKKRQNLLFAQTIARSCTERLQSIAIISRKSFVAEKALRMIAERLSKMSFVVIHGPMMNCYDGLLSVSLV